MSLFKFRVLKMNNICHFMCLWGSLVSITEHSHCSQINIVIDMGSTTEPSVNLSILSFKRHDQVLFFLQFLGCIWNFPRSSWLSAGICPNSRLDDGVPRAHLLARPHELVDYLAGFSAGWRLEVITGKPTRSVHCSGLQGPTRCLRVRVCVCVRFAGPAERSRSGVASLPA